MEVKAFRTLLGQERPAPVAHDSTITSQADLEVLMQTLVSP